MSGITDSIRLGIIGVTLVGGSYLVGKCSYEPDFNDVKEYVKEDKINAIEVYEYSKNHMIKEYPELIKKESKLESNLKEEPGFFDKTKDKLSRAYDALTE